MFSTRSFIPHLPTTYHDLSSPTPRTIQHIFIHTHKIFIYVVYIILERKKAPWLWRIHSEFSFLYIELSDGRIN